ncbi:FAD-dependent oxidoreductase [Modestobacter sp. NPDC049651]|uniref:FAD-dependent oxidoreductase n=1 Tax=unclassified Modestobacter TaxID=2643866 RepID=UPI00340AEF63
MAAIVVLGGGVCGLATALLLSRDGHDVLVLERDPAPVPDDPGTAWDTWERAGVAQFHLAHFLHARTTRLTEAELPDVAARLVAAGGYRHDPLDSAPPTLGPIERRPGDERFVTVTARRPTLEQVVARAAEEEPGLRVERGVVVDGLLLGTADGVPHVTGVRTRGGRQVPADLVVDATGRRSPLPGWLRAAGRQPPREEAEDSGFAYYGRFFRTPDGGSRPEVRASLNSPLGSFSLLTLPSDRDTWSVTLVTDAHDRPLKELRHTDVWTSVVAACPRHAHWLDGVPLTDVVCMAGLQDRLRRLVVDGRPVVTGLVPVADAWSCTNPSLGRGISLGLVSAVLLRDVLRAGADDDPTTFAVRWDAALELELVPWYRTTLAVDRGRLAEMRADRDGAPATAPPGAPGLGAALGQAAGQDADLFRALLEVIGCLTLPSEVFRRPGLADRALQLAGDRPAPGLPGPDRRQLLELVG